MWQRQRTTLMGGTSPHIKPMYWNGDTTHAFLIGGTIRVGEKYTWEGDTAHTFLIGGTIRVGEYLYTETCQILSLAEHPRWNRVWQK